MLHLAHPEAKDLENRLNDWQIQKYSAKRLCDLCDLREVESEIHFPFVLFKRDPTTSWCTDDQKLEQLFNFDVFKCDIFVSKAWKRRQDRFFCWYLF